MANADRYELQLAAGAKWCAREGHAWVPAGGGMLICARCEETCWDDALEAPDAEH
jgi:hypothetical protein